MVGGSDDKPTPEKRIDLIANQLNGPIFKANETKSYQVDG